MMNQTQYIQNLALAGHSLVITGQAGSGKTTLLKHIAEDIRAQKKSVHICASTGIATLQYNSATTLHSWGGLRDGRFSDSQLTNLIRTDEAYETAKKNILACDTLIIDEISMISKKTFETMNTVCQNIRGNQLLFGGIQLLLTGDFLQLSPVPDIYYGDMGEPCFMSEEFHKIHHITLQEVRRQTDETFINIIRKVSAGSIEQDDPTDVYMNSLDHPIDLEDTAVHIFSTNMECDFYNAKKLHGMSGEFRVYTAIDTGNELHLRHIQAPKKLYLKWNCPVILLRNLSKNVVNGMTGTVIDLQDESVGVKLDDGRIINVPRVSFSRYSVQSDDQLIASRTQIPLKPAFGLTFHKSQGMTLERAVIDASHVFTAGQLGVGISRVRSVKDLRVINYDHKRCPVHPKQVHEFLEFQGPEIREDISCCYKLSQHVKISTENLSELPVDTNHDCIDDFNVTEEDFKDSDWDEDDLVDIDRIVTEGSVSTSGDNLIHIIDAQALLESLINKNPTTEEQQRRNDIIKTLMKQEKRMNDFVSKSYSEIMNIYNETIQGKTEAKDMTAFMTKFHVLLQESGKNLFSSLETTATKNAVACEIQWAIKSYILSSKAEYFVEQQKDSQRTNSTHMIHMTLTGPGRGKLRYLGGRCVAKAKYALRKQAFNNLYTNPDLSQRNLKKIRALEQLEVSQYQIFEITEDSASLEETMRRQNISCSLINISDSCFQFFLMLDQKRREKETVEQFHISGPDILQNIVGDLLACPTLQEIWQELLEGHDAETVQSLFNNIIGRFMRVANNQFRKTLMQSLGRKKKKAHRTEIECKKKAQCDLLHTLSRYQDDTSANKQNSHDIWRASLKVNSMYFNSDAFKKADLQAICNVYKLKSPVSHTKVKLAEALARVVPSLDTIPGETSTESTPSTSLTVMNVQEGTTQGQVDQSTQENIVATASISQKSKTTKGKRKGAGNKGKAIAKKKNLDDICVICNVEYGVKEDTWIECGSCKRWLHWQCSGLAYETVQNIDEDEEYDCPKCQKCS